LCLTMRKKTWANLMSKLMRVYSLGILKLVKHIEFIIKELWLLKNPFMWHLMNLTPKAWKERLMIL
jgi:hypothetical protein